MKLNDREVNNAIGALFLPVLNAFSRYSPLPLYLQEVETFSRVAEHFDERWYRFSQELQSFAAERGVKTVVKDYSVELFGPEYASVTFTVCNLEEDTDLLEIDFSELEGMTRDEAIDYLEGLPSEVEPFWYVEVDLSNFKTSYQITDNVVTVYPDREMLSKLFDCFDNELKAIEEAERKVEKEHAELVASGLESEIATTAIVEGLKSLGWTGKYVVEPGYAGSTLMILLSSGCAARIWGTADEIVRSLPDFLSFCKNYPDVENLEAYLVRRFQLDLSIFNSL